MGFLELLVAGSLGGTGPKVKVHTSLSFAPERACKRAKFVHKVGQKNTSTVAEGLACKRRRISGRPFSVFRKRKDGRKYVCVRRLSNVPQATRPKMSSLKALLHCATCLATPLRDKLPCVSYLARPRTETVAESRIEFDCILLQMKHFYVSLLF